MTPSPVILVPTRDQVQSLVVGDMALDCFGNWSPVTEIYASRDDINGRAFVCFYTQFGDNGTISHSYKEGELVRTVALSNLYTSDQLRQIEREAKR